MRLQTFEIQNATSHEIDMSITSTSHLHHVIDISSTRARPLLLVLYIELNIELNTEFNTE